MTTLAEYANGLAVLAIPGVVHDFGMEPPFSLTEAGMPCKWLRLPKQPRSQYVFSVDGLEYQGTGLMTVEVVIAVEAVNMGLPEPNFRNTVALTDAACKAIITADVAMSWPTANARVDIVMVSEMTYWAVVAQATARG